MECRLAYQKCSWKKQHKQSYVIWFGHSLKEITWGHVPLSLKKKQSRNTLETCYAFLTPDKQVTLLKQMLQRLREENLKLCLDKCNIF